MTRPRLVAFGSAGLLVAGFVAANAHLVLTAIGSQPDCVIEAPPKEGAAPRAADCARLELQRRPQSPSDRLI